MSFLWEEISIPRLHPGLQLAPELLDVQSTRASSSTSTVLALHLRLSQKKACTCLKILLQQDGGVTFSGCLFSRCGGRKGGL